MNRSGEGSAEGIQVGSNGYYPSLKEFLSHWTRIYRKPSTVSFAAGGATAFLCSDDGWDG